MQKAPLNGVRSACFRRPWTVVQSTSMFLLILKTAAPPPFPSHLPLSLHFCEFPSFALCSRLFNFSIKGLSSVTFLAILDGFLFFDPCCLVGPRAKAVTQRTFDTLKGYLTIARKHKNPSTKPHHLFSNLQIHSFFDSYTPSTCLLLEAQKSLLHVPLHPLNFSKYFPFTC